MADFVTPTLLPPPLARDLSLRALEAVQARVSDIDIRPMMIYDFNHVALSALPHLAEQFHVMGVEGWALAITEQQRRRLLAIAVALHRHKGTPWAMETVLKAYGYPDCEIVEHRQLTQEWRAAGGELLDGVGTLNGDSTLSAPRGAFRFTTSHWAEYVLRLNTVDGITTRPMLRQIAELCTAWAPARSKLVGVLLLARFAFSATPTLVGYQSRLHVRLRQCRRISVNRIDTLDGCDLIGGKTEQETLAGTGTLDGKGTLDPITLIGEPLDSGQLGIGIRLRQQGLSAMGGARNEVPEYLDGNGTLDGVGNLGVIPGPDQLWFSGWIRVRKGSTSVRESI